MTAWSFSTGATSCHPQARRIWWRWPSRKCTTSRPPSCSGSRWWSQAGQDRSFGSRWRWWCGIQACGSLSGKRRRTDPQAGPRQHFFQACTLVWRWCQLVESSRRSQQGGSRQRGGGCRVCRQSGDEQCYTGSLFQQSRLQMTCQWRWDNLSEHLSSPAINLNKEYSSRSKPFSNLQKNCW